MNIHPFQPAGDSGLPPRVHGQVMIIATFDFSFETGKAIRLLGQH